MLTVSLCVPLAGGAAAACLSQAEARQAVSSGQARPLGSMAGAAGGEIVRADLCEQGGRLVYVLSVLSGGRVVQRVLDARSGKVLK
ncbi:PepSY domain-containing protein [Stappia sp. F7233]|uniref:PepSY domain-containing protein n=1 Tax=Stappia albiluteola TaxID=2758565 RepID=A0A839ABI6_9HYPH|nr:PepSY domain-containing protein [Stappia albiluteola]